MWKWRLLNEEGVTWSDFISVRYGDSSMWRPSIPIKVGVFGCRFILNKLPTRDVLKAQSTYFDR